MHMSGRRGGSWRLDVAPAEDRHLCWCANQWIVGANAVKRDLIAMGLGDALCPHLELGPRPFEAVVAVAELARG